MRLRLQFLALFIGLMITASACAGPTPAISTDIPSDFPPEAALQVQRLLSDRENIPIQQIEINSAEQVEWPDACLGLPDEEQVCAQVVTPGWRIDLTVNGDRYIFRTDESGAVVRQESPEPEQSVDLFLVALEDAGKAGMEIGCGDSLVKVTETVAGNALTPQLALQALLNINERNNGQSGLYNALHNSALQIEDFSLESGKAIAHLSGDLSLGGVCDTPRLRQQLRQTLLQFPQVDQVELFINGEPLEDVLSAAG